MRAFFNDLGSNRVGAGRHVLFRQAITILSRLFVHMLQMTNQSAQPRLALLKIAAIADNPMTGCTSTMMVWKTRSWIFQTL
jgi:hypothetical protein